MTIRGGIYCVGKLYPCPQRGLLEGVFSIYTVKPLRVILLLQRLADIKIITVFSSYIYMILMLERINVGQGWRKNVSRTLLSFFYIFCLFISLIE